MFHFILIPFLNSIYYSWKFSVWFHVCQSQSIFWWLFSQVLMFHVFNVWYICWVYLILIHAFHNYWSILLPRMNWLQWVWWIPVLLLHVYNVCHMRLIQLIVSNLFHNSCSIFIQIMNWLRRFWSIIILLLHILMYYMYVWYN